jgi:hypothetical protein
MAVAFGGTVTDLLRAITVVLRAVAALIPAGSTSQAATALATTVVAGAALAAVLVLLARVVSAARAVATVPLLRRASALREKSWHAAFLRQCDPDAAGRPRPRAPSAAPAAAVC